MQTEQSTVKVIMQLVGDKETMANELFDLLKDLRELAESRGFEVLL